RLAIVRAREADLRELTLLVVVLPAIDLAVFVAIDTGADRTRAVHVGPGVDPPVLVCVVGELLEPAGALIVGGLGGLLEAFLVGIGAGEGHNTGDSHQRDGTGDQEIRRFLFLLYQSLLPP